MLIYFFLRAPLAISAFAFAKRLTEQLTSFTPGNDSPGGVYRKTHPLILLSQDRMSKKCPGSDGSKPGEDGCSFQPSSALACLSGVRYPTRASSEKCIDFSGVLFASSALSGSCLTHLFSHLSFFFFLSLSHESYASALLFPLQ